MPNIRLTASAALSAALALSACNQSAAPGTAPESPAAMATTNATVEPLPTETAPATSGTPGTAATPVPSSNPAPAQTTDGADECGAAKVTPFVGRQDRPTTRADLEKAVGHDRIRWIGPDDAVTMDFNAARLNVLLDKTKRLITGARCG